MGFLYQNAAQWIKCQRGGGGGDENAPATEKAGGDTQKLKSLFCEVREVTVGTAESEWSFQAAILIRVRDALFEGKKCYNYYMLQLVLECNCKWEQKFTTAGASLSLQYQKSLWIFGIWELMAPDGHTQSSYTKGNACYSTFCTWYGLTPSPCTTLKQISYWQSETKLIKKAMLKKTPTTY